jgi:uncharacterized protein YjiS (DUF1127 family)
MLKQMKKWLEYRHTCEVLMAQSDRNLADIGIIRSDIPAVARGRCAESGSEKQPKTWLRHPADRMRQLLNMWLGEYASRRRIRRELSAYRDDELAEIGIRRADINAIARGDVPAGSTGAFAHA